MTDRVTARVAKNVRWFSGQFWRSSWFAQVDIDWDNRTYTLVTRPWWLWGDERGSEMGDDAIDPMKNPSHPSWWGLPEIGEDGIMHSLEFVPGRGNQCLPDCAAEAPHAHFGEFFGAES